MLRVLNVCLTDNLRCTFLEHSNTVHDRDEYKIYLIFLLLLLMMMMIMRMIKTVLTVMTLL